MWSAMAGAYWIRWGERGRGRRAYRGDCSSASSLVSWIMEMKNPHVIWASVAIVAMLLAASVTLVALGKDVIIILSLAGMVAVPVLAAFGVAVYQKIDQVKEQGNGNVERGHEFLKELLKQQQDNQNQLTALAMSMTPNSASPVVVEEEKPKDGL